MKKHISRLLLLAAAAIWGFAFSAQKASDSLNPFALGAIRSAIAAIFLIFIIIIFDKIRHTGRALFSKRSIIDLSKTEIVGGAICGAVLTAATFFQQSGLNAGTDAGKSAFITALYIVLIPIYTLPFGGRAKPRSIISVIIAVVGFYFLCIKGDFTVVSSDLIVLVCALIFPIHIIAVDRFTPKCDGIRMSLVQFITAALLNSLLMLILEPLPTADTIIDCIIPLLFLGVGSSGIAYTLQILGQRGVDPTSASIIMSLESVFGVVGSAMLLGEKMTEREYIGSAIVFFAVLLSQIEPSEILSRIKRKKQN